MATLGPRKSSEIYAIGKTKVFHYPAEQDPFYHIDIKEG